MKTEYKYLLVFAAWMVVWMTLPLVAFVLMVLCLGKTFYSLRKERLARQRKADMLKDPKMRDWLRMEGFDIPMDEPEESWKR